jgi:hypothetical protein
MTKLRLYILLITSLTLSSCGDRHEGEQKPTLLSNLVSISDNEDKGVKEILEYYGGQCKYAIGATASTDNGSVKYFELEISGSEVIEKYSNIAAMPSSNIAYLFYRNLKDEKNKYDQIHAVLILKDNSKITYKFSKEKLEIVDQKMNIVNKVVALLKEKNYGGIKSMLTSDTTFINLDKEKYIANITNADPQFGNIKEFTPYGFRFDETEDGSELLHISGILRRDKQSNEFSVIIDPKSTKDEIIVMEYKW